MELDKQKEVSITVEIENSDEINQLVREVRYKLQAFEKAVSDLNKTKLKVKTTQS